MRRSWSVVLSFLLVLVATLGGAGPTAPARADTVGVYAGTPLPFPTFTDMTTDRVHDVAYLAGGLADGKVAVVDGAGTVVRTYDTLAYPTSLTLSADASTLYIYLEKSADIVAIDLASGSRRTYPTGGTDGCNADLAAVDGHVWFVTCDEQDTPNGVSALDPVDGTVYGGLHDEYYVSHLLADTSVPGTLFVVGDAHISELRTGHDSSGAPELTPSVVRAGGTFGVNEVTISADGQQLLAGSAVLRTSDLALVDSHPAPGEFGGTAVAESTAGVVAVGGSTERGPDVTLYRAGHTVFGQPVVHNDPSATRDRSYIEDQGLAFGGTTLFTVTGPHASAESVPVAVHVSVPAPPADPIGSDTLDLRSVGQIVSDPGHDQAFVSTGYADNGVVVVDGRGRITHVVQHLPGITEMTRSGGTVWLSLEGADSVASIDTSTYAVHTYSTGAGSAPQAVAVAVGQVWFSSRTLGDGQAEGLGTVDPATGQLRPKVSDVFLQMMRSSALHPNSIYGLGPVYYDHPPPYYHHPPETRVQVAGGSRPSVEVKAQGDIGYEVTDAVETFDRLHVAYAVPDDLHRAAGAVDMAPSGLGGDDATAVAARGDGLVASGYDDNNHGYAVAMRYGALGPVVSTVSKEPDGQLALLPIALAFGRTGLYAVGRTLDGYRVSVLPTPPRQPVSLSTDQDAYHSGQALEVVAHVDPQLLSQHPVVTVTEQRNGDAPRVLATRRVPDTYANLTLGSTFEKAVTYRATVSYGSHTVSTRLVRHRPQ